MAEYLISFNDEWVPEHTDEQIRAKAVASRAVIEEMQAAGVFIYGNGALDARSVVGHVVSRGGEAVFGEGRYADNPEHLGGFALVDVADDEAARYWAGRLAVALDWPQEIHRFPPSIGGRHA